MNQPSLSSTATARPAKRKLSWKGKLAMLGFSSLLSLVVLEVAIRVLLPTYDPSGIVAFKLQDFGAPLGEPNYVGRSWKKTGDFDVEVRINELGFRDALDVREATEGDIVFVGDSFTFGVGVEQDERFSTQMSDIAGTRTFNIGIPGSNIAQYERLVEYAEKQGASISHLVIAVCMENDLQNYELPPQAPTVKGVFWKVKQKLAGNLAMYNAFSTTLHNLPSLHFVLSSVGLADDVIDDMNKNGLDEAVITSSVDHIANLAERFDTTVLIIPSRGLWVGDNQKNERLVHQQFVQGLRDRGLSVVDMQGEFEKRGNPMQNHFEYDGHWNRVGHRAAAEVLAERVGTRSF